MLLQILSCAILFAVLIVTVGPWWGTALAGFILLSLLAIEAFVILTDPPFDGDWWDY